VKGKPRRSGFRAFRPPFHAVCRTPLETARPHGYSTHIDQQDNDQPEENIMNVIKHMEAAFVVALGLAAATSAAFGRIQPARAATPAAATTAGIPVVHVTAKRLTPAEKQQMLALERVRSRA
jgi:5,10-methylenetetrahydrofolate reductase